MEALIKGVLLVAAIFSSPAEAQPFNINTPPVWSVEPGIRFYKVDIGPANDLIEGYSRLEWGADKHVSGSLCLYKGGSIDTNRPGVILDELKVDGVYSDETADISLTFNQSTKRSTLETLITGRSFKISQQGEQVEWKPLLRRGVDWAYEQADGVSASDLSKLFILKFRELPAEVNSSDTKQGEGHTYINIYSSKKRGETREFDLAKLDKMTPKQAMAFLSKLPIDDIISPGFIELVYKTERRQEIKEYLAQFGKTAWFDNPPLPDCGAPYVQDTLRVTPTLEFYITRQLLRSGLVINAYPEVWPKSPPFQMVTMSRTPLARMLQDGSLSINEKSDRLASFLKTKVKAFLDTKRPRFAGRWQIDKRNGGSDLIYRVQIVGASISECQSTGWEKFDLQIIPSTIDAGPGQLSLLVQAPEGYRAPQSLRQRPPDDRFKDNPMNDEQLAKIQEGFVSFLEASGVGQSQAEDDSRSSCPL